MLVHVSKRQSLCSDLLDINEAIYVPCNLKLENFLSNTESNDYEACTFDLNGCHIEFRKAKITPKKMGQFVAFWKREKIGAPIIPYDMADEFDLLIISACNHNNFGMFVFPKNILKEKGVISNKGNGGKRALRLYAPWDNPDSPQAKKTKAWQNPYFIEIKPPFNNIMIQRFLKILSE